MLNTYRKLIYKSKGSQPTPYLISDLHQINHNFNRLKKALPNTEIYFSIKSNNDSQIIKHLAKIGSNFDVASWGEIALAKSLGIPASRMVYSSPIKPFDHIQKAYKYGIRQYAYDSLDELEKLKQAAPNSQVILRIMVESEGSQCPMFKKFGVYVDEALTHLKAALSCNLKPTGLTFHVGSQCLNRDAWINAIFRANKIWEEAYQNNIQLHLINLGGGLPTTYDQKIDKLESFTKTIKKALDRNFVGRKSTYIEPGRYMTSEASIVVSTVIGKADRGNVSWIYLDVGGFNGLFEIFENFNYDIQTDHPKRTKKEYAVAGPTCDGMDIIRKSIFLPKVNVGEKIYILNTGAYSTSIEHYNGFPYPKSLTIG